MITFWPNKTERWAKEFTFNEIRIGLAKNNAGFRNREDLIEFLKAHGVNMISGLTITKQNIPDFLSDARRDVFSVVTDGEVLGWIEDDYR